MSDTTNPKADWYDDPTGRKEKRYWNGSAWTEHVFSGGVQAIDPMTMVSPEAAQPAQAAIPPKVDAATEVTTPSAATSPAVPVRAAPTPQPASPKVALFGARKQAKDLIEENARLEKLIGKYGLEDVLVLDTARVELEQEVSRQTHELANAQASTQAVLHERADAQQAVVNLRDTAALQEFGLYDYEHPAESSVELGTALEGARAQIKSTVRSGTATSASQGFTFNNSPAKGRKFVSDMSKLLLRAYNAEAENCVKTVRAGNLASAQKRLSTVVAQVERLGTMIDLKISSSYHRLRLTELELASRHLQALQAEKELERARRDELREQRKAEQELAREKEKLSKERDHYSNALAALEEKGDIEGAERLRAKLADVTKAIEDVDYRAANVRAGYVYVISNIGAFGPNVVKIGLTRRLEPMDRVNELGDASVPFRFDVHALFFADDAVSVETMLHQHFADQRLNKVNLRREYFRTTPSEVLEALKEHSVEVLEYTLEPAAPEYRSSVAVTV